MSYANEDGYIFYTLEPGSSAERELQILKRDRSKAFEAWHDFAKSVGANPDKYCITGTSLSGVLFEGGQAPAGWFFDKSDNTGRPHGHKNPEEYKRWKALPSMPGGRELEQRLGIPLTVVTKNGRTFIPAISVEPFEATTVIGLHESLEPPDGLTPLMQSEYWALKEKETAA